MSALKNSRNERIRDTYPFNALNCDFRTAKSPPSLRLFFCVREFMTLNLFFFPGFLIYSMSLNPSQSRTMSSSALLISLNPTLILYNSLLSYWKVWVRCLLPLFHNAFPCVCCLDLLCSLRCLVSLHSRCCPRY